MFDTNTLLILIPALPLVAAIATAALGPRVLRGQSHVPVVTALVLSFVASMALVFQVERRIERSTETRGAMASAAREAEIVTLWTWADLGRVPIAAGSAASKEFRPAASGEFKIEVALWADPLTAVMLAIVTCVSSLVAVYSIGYMRGDPGNWRFFSYVGLFVFSMTTLVAASNFVLLYVCWELVGLCSYLLIGFWYEKPTAAAAGMKAFLVNRIGDVGFALGIFLIWTLYGTLNFHDTLGPNGNVTTMGVLSQARISAGQFVGGWPATAICLLLFLGACGKSAQFPLHVWLPDAMEGPTPVSALIHAATMVTAGVYMVARCMPLFLQSTDAQYVVAAIGGGTALLGAIIALTQTDLKRILAYSTISHLGYMFLALGTATLAGVTAGMFHLMTHAFFKALLFLGAGSVMHAMGGVIDIERFGGLRHRMPVTHATFLVGCLAIAGLCPFAGFWSKDAILMAVRGRAGADAGELYGVLFATAMFGVVLIDFYMFRPYFRTFFGPERIPPEAGRHAHESPGTMTAPLIVLAFASAVTGAYFEYTHGFAHFLAATPSLACLSEAAEATGAENLGLASTVITVVGIAAAALVFLGNRNKAARLARAMNVFGLYSVSFGKFFFDAIYRALVVGPLLLLARLAAWLDGRAIDGAVDACGNMPKLLGAVMRAFQNGIVQFYALAMMLGLLILMGALLMMY
jgi:NADH-quinone oxidoreductase subunit L